MLQSACTVQTRQLLRAKNKPQSLRSNAMGCEKNRSEISLPPASSLALGEASPTPQPVTPVRCPGFLQASDTGAANYSPAAERAALVRHGTRSAASWNTLRSLFRSGRQGQPPVSPPPLPWVAKTSAWLFWGSQSWSCSFLQAQSLHGNRT